MKTIINNKIILIWFTIILLIANLSAMITVYYKIKQYSLFTPHQNQTLKANENIDFPTQPIVNLLKFDHEQIKRFQELRKNHQTAMMSYNADLHQIRQEIAMELSSDFPDERKLEKLAEDFGRIQIKLKQMSFKHFVQVKEICNEEQKRIFNANMNKVVEKQEPGPGFRHRRQYGKKMRFNN